MNLRHYIKKALSMPPQALVKKVVKKINAKVKDKLQKRCDLSKGTHIKFNVPLIQNSYIDIKELDTSHMDIKVARYLSQMYCEHRFDLLGSGWVKNSYDSVALGVEGYKYDMNVQSPKSIGDEYELIDWQKDYKSGYRWSQKTWYKDHPIGHKLGVDIKVPWELSRFQHLPQLAIFSMIDQSLKKKNIEEFRFQILDFIENNPPRMGVNWVCTMDVGIRASNMLVAYDLFCQIDSFGILDDEFKQTFANSIYEHGLHIVNNLEYSEFGRHNHYLGDIAGLLFVSSYLENTDEINQWLAFSIQEIISEMDYEFYEDGGNFEGSTSYHRLSGELIIYSIALILGLKEDKVKVLQSYSVKGWRVKPRLLPFEKQQFKIGRLQVKLPQYNIDKLYKIGRFTVDIMKPNGEVPQFGDNDSGRFFRLSPNGKFLTNKMAVDKYINLRGHIVNEELFWDENILEHSTFVSCFSGLYKDDIFKNNMNFEKSFINSLIKNKFDTRDISYKDITKNIHKLNDLNYKKSILHKMQINMQELKHTFYPDSGIYIFKSNDFYLAFCMTPLGLCENGGHGHNDKLSYELWYKNEDIIKDPGTYLYTALGFRRDEFRSVNAHNTMVIEGVEQNNFRFEKLFGLEKQSDCYLLDINKDYLSVLLEYNNGLQQVRKIRITPDNVTIEDASNKFFKYTKFNKYSNGYGKLEILGE